MNATTVAAGTNLAHLHTTLITPGLKVRELRTNWAGTVVRFSLDPVRRQFRGAVVDLGLGGRHFILATELITV